MLTLGIVSLALALGFLYIYQTRIKPSQGPKLRGAEKLRALQERQQKEKALKSAELSIENVMPGGVVHLEGVGLRSESFDVQVKGRHLHKSGQARSVELEADRGGQTVFLTLEDEGDGLSVLVSLEKLPLKSVGLAAEELDQLTHESTLTHEGTAYHPAEHGHAVYCRDHDELNPEPYEFWEFSDDDEEAFLTVVRWQDGSVELHPSVHVANSFITVYSTS